MRLEEAFDTTVSRKEAFREIRRHGADFTEFLRDCGDFPEYDGSIVLTWLGY